MTITILLPCQYFSLLILMLLEGTHEMPNFWDYVTGVHDREGWLARDSWFPLQDHRNNRNPKVGKIKHSDNAPAGACQKRRKCCVYLH